MLGVRARVFVEQSPANLPRALAVYGWIAYRTQSGETSAETLDASPTSLTSLGRSGAFLFGLCVLPPPEVRISAAYFGITPFKDSDSFYPNQPKIVRGRPQPGLPLTGRLIPRCSCRNIPGCRQWECPCLRCLRSSHRGSQSGRSGDGAWCPGQPCCPPGCCRPWP